MEIIGIPALYEYSKRKKVANCEIKNNKLISAGTYNITEDTKFNADIAEKY